MCSLLIELIFLNPLSDNSSINHTFILIKTSPSLCKMYGKSNKVASTTLLLLQLFCSLDISFQIIFSLIVFPLIWSLNFLYFGLKWSFKNLTVHKTHRNSCIILDMLQSEW